MRFITRFRFTCRSVFTYLGGKPGDFPEAEKAAKEVLALPIYPELTDEMKEYVVNTILDFFS